MATTKKRKTIKVVCNPYAAIDVDDGESRCAGSFPFEPSRHNDDTDVRHVGARRIVTEVSPARPKDRVQADHAIAYEFHHEPVELPQSKYYWRAMKDGPAGSRALLPADAATHAWVFGSPAGFKDPHAIIAQKALEHGFMPAAFFELSESEEESAKATLWEDVLAPHIEAIKAAKDAAEKAFAEAQAKRAAEAAKPQHEAAAEVAADVHADHDHK
jgi:hypothetical protein